MKAVFQQMRFVNKINLFFKNISWRYTKKVNRYSNTEMLLSPHGEMVCVR
jgi:hypothetical protein